MRLNNPMERFRDVKLSGDALHVIAIENLKDEERTLRRWWTKKYRTPERPLEDYTLEELYVEYLEDYYERNPKAAEEFLRRLRGGKKVDEWDGTLPPGVEERAAAYFKRVRAKHRTTVDLSKYRDTAPVSDDEEKRILESLGRKLPGSRRQSAPPPPALGAGEFEDQFGE